MISMFEFCYSLKSVYFYNIDTSSVTSMKKMFNHCRSLKSIDLSKFDTSSVVNMEQMFYGCDSLNFLDLSNFDMMQCLYYDKMFSDNNNIKFLNLNNFKNPKGISEYFSSNENIFVCQKDTIIEGSNVQACCNYNFLDDECQKPEESEESKKGNISKGAVAGIVIGIILLVIIVILIFIFRNRIKNIICEENKKSKESKESTEIINFSSMNKSNGNYIYDYEPDNYSNQAICIFKTSRKGQVKIKIDDTKPVELLIQFYFKIIRKPLLFGNDRIQFYINGELVPHKSKDTINKFTQGKNDGNIIMVVDENYI